MDEPKKFAYLSDGAAENALAFLHGKAGEAGIAKARVIETEGWVKITKNRLMLQSMAKSISAQEVEAYSHKDYKAALDAHVQAVQEHETLYWKRLAAEAIIESWRTFNANNRGAGRMM
jgi:hypothetical protein